jgi:hypothetical protein
MPRWMLCFAMIVVGASPAFARGGGAYLGGGYRPPLYMSPRNGNEFFTPGYTHPDGTPVEQQSRLPPDAAKPDATTKEAVPYTRLNRARSAH